MTEQKTHKCENCMDVFPEDEMKYVRHSLIGNYYAWICNDCDDELETE